MTLIVPLLRGLGLAASALPLAGCASMSPGAASRVLRVDH